MKKLQSAKEIAALGLPGMPTTRVAVAEKAKREGWYFEERSGLGGMRRVYEVPQKYLPVDQQANEGTSEAVPQVGKVAGYITAGGRIDPAKLEVAMRALDEWERERGVRIAKERRPAVIALLYDYAHSVEGDASEAMSVVFRAIG